MNTKFCFMVVLCLAVNVNIFAQRWSTEKINQFNSQGKREGLWRDTFSYCIYEQYYRNGIKNGFSKEYNRETRNLYTFGEYKDGQMCGTWFFFEITGHLMFILKDFGVNTTPVKGRKAIPEYKCYFIGYYPNGNIENEGELLWYAEDVPESDTSVEYGKWKYYDENGNLIETKVFK